MVERPGWGGLATFKDAFRFQGYFKQKDNNPLLQRFSPDDLSYTHVPRNSEKRLSACRHPTFQTQQHN